MRARAEHPALRRVAITGLGLVTPLGVGIEPVWSRLAAGETGIGVIDRFETADLPCRIAGLVPQGRYADGGFDEREWLPAKDSRKMDRFAKYAMAAASQALDDAGWQPDTDTQRERTGVLIGSGIGGLPGISEAALALQAKGPRAISPFFIPSNLVNLAAGHVAIRHGLRGPTHAVATACASGAHALGDAARMIMLGDADVMVAGGAEAAVCRLGIAGFCAARALSTSFNDEPHAASRPWDARRDGFVMGEGSGIVVLEDYEHALRRGARIHAELIGYGLSGDGHHIAAPRADGDGAARAMSMAIERAGIEPAAIDYVNAHATSTHAGDEIELQAITRVFGAHATQGLSISSTKGATGHLLGAAGSVEAIITILAMRAQTAPPTLNLHEPPQQFRDIDLVARSARSRPIRFALSNSFGFGGTNAALVFARPQ
jgi:3-oxoacyl-[acyl-carrier-protein] synthase II